MTQQDEDAALRPAWRRRAQAAEPAAPPEPAEPAAPPAPPEPEPAPPPAPAPTPSPDAEADAGDLERGRTVALIAALGRLQMSVDLLARQQRKQHDALLERLDRLERARYGEGTDG
ncbi:MAG TPA: hypothetical protein VFQ85_14070 [Mycobacteriales bacterium]|jgi:hypothetical protein|nr:hypothetical protein [Mycobacteriales bacterium]